MRTGLKAITILLFIFSACLVRAEPVIDAATFIDQKVRVTGLAGTPWEANFSFDEERSRAWMDALHHAYENILNLPLMEGKLVRHVLQTNPALKERLGIIILSAPKKFYQPDNTGLARCVVEVPLSGKLSLRSALYLAALRPRSQQPLSFLASWSAPINEENLPVPEFKRLIIDVRDYYYEPSIFPRIFADNGALIFQEAMIPQPERFSRPAIRFSTDIVKAHEGLSEEEFMISLASINELACRDVTVANSDVAVVSGFCNQMVKNPDKELEIIIVYDSEKKLQTGKMDKTKPEKQNDSKAK
ncbi:MAG: hypothetical protein PWR01_4027 [Clostridiales bacterium]|jgi:hypothetical protein|nr:hypothetical protein [Clostridiales bacterium]MDN5282954.1 hypothetical protein [Candidatus Ozemobacter sp.]